MIRKSLSLFACLFFASCGVVYTAPSVSTRNVAGVNVQVQPLTARSVRIANSSPYTPKSIPAAFYQVSAVPGTMRGAGRTPKPVFSEQTRPGGIETRLPPAVARTPYQIGVGDVLLLATPSAGSTLEELSGLLAAQNRRQGYTVQDDGAISIPDIGRIPLAGMTLQEAEGEIFQQLVTHQIDPSFSLEISEFNSKKVSIGGAVQSPTFVPITLMPIYLDDALTAAGSVVSQNQEYAVVRIYRDGRLYQIPYTELYSKRSLQKIPLMAGDSIFVDTAYDLEKAQAYFAEQIALTNFKSSARAQALSELKAEMSLRQDALQQRRQNFLTQLDLGATERDYVYVTGEVKTQNRFALPFEHTASLADALYDGGGFNSEKGDPSQIYVLRGSGSGKELSAITAWHLDAGNAVNIILATRMELRPNDIIFVAEQPITSWNRVLSQILPTITLASATGN